MNRALYRLADNRDARVMIAREVYAEWVWRGTQERVTPAECAALDCFARPQLTPSVLAFVEQRCGEPLLSPEST
jgi:hypothetical protein